MSEEKAGLKLKNAISRHHPNWRFRQASRIEFGCVRIFDRRQEIEKTCWIFIFWQAYIFLLSAFENSQLTVRPRWRMSTLHEITRWCQHKYCDFISAIKINMLIQVLHQSIKLTHLHFGSVHVMFVVGFDSNLKFTTCAMCLRFSTWQVKYIRNLHQVKFFWINSRKLILQPRLNPRITQRQGWNWTWKNAQ